MEFDLLPKTKTIMEQKVIIIFYKCKKIVYHKKKCKIQANMAKSQQYIFQQKQMLINKQKINTGHTYPPPKKKEKLAIKHI